MIQLQLKVGRKPDRHWALDCMLSLSHAEPEKWNQQLGLENRFETGY
jgi:hypothetical protein